MGARWYSPLLGHFLSADSIVPRPGDPQSLNRYAYTRNSPITRVDPNGHADCAAGDNACWISAWEWRNRWYESHSFFSNGAGYIYKQGDARFYSIGFVDSLLAEAGIYRYVKNNILDIGSICLGQAIADMAYMMGGTSALHQALGGSRVQVIMGVGPDYNQDGRSKGNTGGVAKNRLDFGVYLLTNASGTSLANPRESRALISHELGHVINYQSHMGLFGLFQPETFLPADPNHLVSLSDYSPDGSSPVDENFAQRFAGWIYGNTGVSSQPTTGQETWLISAFRVQVSQ